MTDETRPDPRDEPPPPHAEPSPHDEQTLLGTDHQKPAEIDTAQELETVALQAADAMNSATIPGALPAAPAPSPATGPAPEKLTLEGDAVPGYDLLGELGRGGMGVVYKARDQKLKRTVALKMILSGTHASDEDMQRFQIEAEAVAKLQHPNIVQIFEVAEHEGRPYIALEFADGGSLDQKIAGTPQNASEAAELVETLARAMQQAHENDIIHRDLKPANILLTAEGEPRITDFGLAKRLDEDSQQTKSGAVMGTPSYMAPEQAAGTSATLGPAADTYALGAILYHLLTGRPPFQAETQLDTIMQVISEEPVAPRKLNSSLPVDLETICLKCLQKDVHRRYESAEALANDLRRFQADEPIHARPVSVVTRGLKWAKRRPAAAGMLGISAAALVALLTGGLWYNAQLVKARDIAQQQRQEAQHQKQLAEGQTKLAETREAEAKRAQQKEAEQRKLAEEQKKVANRNFKLARDAVDELTNVSEDELFNLPQMEPVRKTLLQKAKAFYVTFVEQAAGDPELRAELGQAHFRLGAILFNLGDHSEATSENEKAIAVFGQLVKDHPDEPDHANSLADSYGNLAFGRRALGQTEEALGLYNKVVLAKEQLVKEHPENQAYAGELAKFYNNLSETLASLGKTDEAIAFLQKATVIGQQLVENNSDVPAFANTLADSYNNLASGLRTLGQMDKVAELYKRAILLDKQLIKYYPTAAQYISNLADSYSNLAQVQHALGQTDEAIEHYEKAILLKEQVVQDHPDVLRYASVLAGSYSGLADVLGPLGQVDKTTELYNKAIQIKEQLVKDHPDMPKFAHSLAISYNNRASILGRTEAATEVYKKAILLAKQLVEAYPNVPEFANSLALSCNNMANVLGALGKPDQASMFYHKAILLRQQLVKAHPAIPTFAGDLAESNLRCGLLEQGRQHFADAMRHYEAALSLLESLTKKGQLPRSLAGWGQQAAQRLGFCRAADRALRDLAFVLAQPPAQATQLLLVRGQAQLDQNDHAGAAESGEQLAELEIPDEQAAARAGNFYNAACLLSLASAAVAKDEELDETERQPLVDKYVLRAMALLKEARSLEFFQDPTMVPHIQKDTDLDALRERDDFQQLLKELTEERP